VVAVQFFGIWKQKGAYLEKFVNLSAIGNAGKNPIGGVNFVVGLFEIVSEIGKIVSLAFRLFGNMFAGGILLIVMTFLVGMLLPAVFIGLEVIITTVQALVFALLTLIFASQAMEGHHGDDHGDGHEEHHA
jgi:F-type H+-transporting ATPase subunit a